MLKIHRVPGIKGARIQVKDKCITRITYKEKRGTRSVTLKSLITRILMFFFVFHLTPGTLDPLAPYIFTLSFGDDPKTL